MRALPVILVVLLSASAGCFADKDDDAKDDTEDKVQTTAPPANDTTLAPVTLEVSLAGAYPVNIAYEPSALAARAGQNVTVIFTNDDQNPVFSHDWVLEGVEGAATETIGNGEASETTFVAPAPGTYAFYCSVPGHRDNGMEGVFTVA